MSKQPSKDRISAAILDELLQGEDPTRALLSGELFGALKKKLAERLLEAERWRFIEHSLKSR